MVGVYKFLRVASPIENLPSCENSRIQFDCDIQGLRIWAIFAKNPQLREIVYEFCYYTKIALSCFSCVAALAKVPCKVFERRVWMPVEVKQALACEAVVTRIFNKKIF